MTSQGNMAQLLRNMVLGGVRGVLSCQSQEDTGTQMGLKEAHRRTAAGPWHEPLLSSYPRGLLFWPLHHDHLR